MSAKISDPIDKQVGSRIRTRRLQLDLSQIDVADALALALPQVQRYEKGISRVDAARLHQLSQILQVSVAFFFEDTPTAAGLCPSADKGPFLPDVTEFLASLDGLALAKAFMHIGDAKLRRAIVRLVEELARPGGLGPGRSADLQSR